MERIISSYNSCNFVKQEIVVGISPESSLLFNALKSN